MSISVLSLTRGWVPIRPLTPRVRFPEEFLTFRLTDAARSATPNFVWSGPSIDLYSSDENDVLEIDTATIFEIPRGRAEVRLPEGDLRSPLQRSEQPKVKSGNLWLRPVRHLVRERWKMQKRWEPVPYQQGNRCDKHRYLELGCDQEGEGCATRLLDWSAGTWHGGRFREGFTSRPSTVKPIIAGGTEVWDSGPNCYPPPIGSAEKSLEQALGGNTMRAQRTWAQGTLEVPRLRRRAGWVNLLVGSLAIPDKSLGAYLSGRWTPDLTGSGANEALKVFSQLLEGGAKFLGAGTAQTRALTEQERKDRVEVTATLWVALVVDGTAVRVFPELLSRLAARACFRARDHTLVPSLKLAGLEWCKSRYLRDYEVGLGLPCTIALACCKTRPEQAAVRVLEGTAKAVEGEGERNWARAVGGWFGGLGSTLSSGLPSGSWWRKTTD